MRFYTVFRNLQIRCLVLPLSLAVSIFVGCDRKQAPSPVPAPPEVTVLTINPQQITLTTELPGRTAAFRIAEIRPQVSGLILKRLFAEGQDVREGQVLYKIDPAPFQSALDNARAALDRALANLPAMRSRARRFQELLPDKAVSQQDYDDASAALNQAEADVAYWKATVATARINLEYTAVKAPISGRIGKSNFTEGAIVTAYQPVALASIQQLDFIYVDATQSTAELLRLKRRLADGRLHQSGTSQGKVQLILEDNTPYPLQGTLQFRDVTVDATTASVMLRMKFPNPDTALLPGMFVRAVVKEGVKEDAILIPQQAVVRDPKGNPLALVVEADNTVKQAALTLDRAIENKWLVTTGLTPGDRIIVDGIQKARSGTVVRIVQTGADPQSAGNNRNTARPATKAN